MKPRTSLRTALSLAGVVALLLWVAPRSAEAVPRFSVTAGSPCTTCHVNPTGGGLRNLIGFESMDDVGLWGYPFTPHNALFDDLLTLGADVRIQMVRLGAPEIPPGETEIVEPEIVVLPMQIQPYLGIKPMDGLWIYGSYTVGPKTIDQGAVCDPTYPGQSCFDAAVQYQPDPLLPTLRAGMIQPSVGVRRDDHTIYIRGDAADRRAPIIAPNYADWGAELSYQPVAWFRSEIGGVQGQGGNLDEAIHAAVDREAELWPVALNARVMFLPQLVFGGAVESEGDGFGDDEFGDDFGDDFDAEPVEPTVINTWIGASAFASGDFLRVDGFAALGLHGGIEVHGEVSLTALAGDYSIVNGLLGASWAPIEPVALAIRGEHATTTLPDGSEATAQQAVVGLELFPVPFVDIRPEYRIVKTDAYLFGQPTVQLHLFY